MIDESAIRERYGLMKGLLNERSRRRWAAAEARSHGRGGIAAVARAMGISEGTVRRGLLELDDDGGEELPADRVRRAGAGRPCQEALKNVGRSALKNVGRWLVGPVEAST